MLAATEVASLDAMTVRLANEFPLDVVPALRSILAMPWLMLSSTTVLTAGDIAIFSRCLPFAFAKSVAGRAEGLSLSFFAKGTLARLSFSAAAALFASRRRASSLSISVTSELLSSTECDRFS